MYFVHSYDSFSHMTAWQQPLAEQISMQLFSQDLLVFSSQGKWLYPLFEAESFLSQHHYEKKTLSLHDRVAGQAVAALCSHLGIGRVHADLMSRLALDAFARYGIEATYARLVPALQCRTESLIDSSMSVEEIHRMLVKSVSL